jgi:hypothetical protein
MKHEFERMRMEVDVTYSEVLHITTFAWKNLRKTWKNISHGIEADIWNRDLPSNRFGANRLDKPVV